MRTSEPRLRAARQAAGWHALRPSGEDLRGLADYVLEVTAGKRRRTRPCRARARRELPAREHGDGSSTT